MVEQTLTETVTKIDSIDGTGTELVTLSVPPDTSITTVKQRIASEHAEAEHIKSDRTRTNVQQALDRVHRILSQYDTIPGTGLVVYAGVVDNELISFVLDDSVLPTPVRDSFYRCDNAFSLKPVEPLLDNRPTHGLIIVERGKACIGTVVGDRVQLLTELESHVMGKSKAGGQSAQRFARDRERQLQEFFHDVGETVNSLFITGDNLVVDGVVVGGTLGTAKQFLQESVLDYRIRDRVVGVYGVEYATKRGLEQLYRKVNSELESSENESSRRVVKSFKERLRDGDDVAYGLEAVEEAAELGGVETLLISSTVDQSTVDELERVVEQHGGDVITVPVSFSEGEMFNDVFGGVGALLRFTIN